VGLKSPRIGLETKAKKVLWGDRHTDSNLARNPGKGSCFRCFRYLYIVLCFGDWNYMPFTRFSALFNWVSGFFPETAWRFKPYHQAAHQRWATVLMLGWIAWQRWVPARRRDAVRVLVDDFDVVLGECNQLLRFSDCIHIYL